MDDTTLEQLYRRHKDFVFRVCSRYARSRDDAEDLTQDTFIKISRSMTSFRGDAEWSTWLYRVAVNSCLDYLRKKKRETHNVTDYLDSMVVKNLESGGDRVLAKIELDRILGHLRPTLRQTLFLTLAEGLSYAETAEVVGISAAAVAKSVSRFLAKSKVSARKADSAPALPNPMSTSTAPLRLKE